MTKFISLQFPEEQKFISFVKTNQFDSCLSKISTETILNFGTTEIRKELKKINGLYKKYGDAKPFWSLGQGYRGVGAFGHNVGGTIEKKMRVRLRR